ncbi:ciliary-associated calcium-binding coiled-coil protein 1 isoform X2 [Protopterus annectens]|uniref:ciliary-associated calcium-binding coiled-coil protein 1 isoform X2 n=1 Tax=Protopterus annectens TaxID=7888 RepID=UPI001CFBFA20|nr:ciliary-associated calcium-binding coiled-coil protein 1 isoform X2 [Protopterus annectens]
MKMEDILNLKHHETCLKQGVILDYYVSGFWWAKEMNFTVQQISSFMTVLHIMLENLSNKSMLLEDSIKELAKLLAGIGIPGSEKSACLDFFSVDQACAVISYLKTSLFQPYKLYEFLFKHPRDEVVLGAEEKVELVITAEGPYPCPLEEGIPYDYFSRFIMPPPTEEAADKMIQQPTQESEDSEIAYETTEMDPMACYTMEDVKLVLGQVTSEVIGSLQSEINEKLRLQEETYTARIEKIKKV